MSKIKEYFRKTLSIMLALAITTNNITSVNAEDDIFDTDCYLNHWGMSDIRSYLNVLFDDENKINRIDSTKLSNNKYGYGRFFSNNEFSLIKPSTVQTNVFDRDELLTATNIYETTDMFFLPSGKFGEKVISWGKEDISDECTYIQKVKNKGDLNRIIPISYWISGVGEFFKAWLRSPCNVDGRENETRALEADRNNCVWSREIDEKDNILDPVFKIDLKDITFSAVASSYDLCDFPGGKRYEFSNKNIGIETGQPIDNYGMHLKTASKYLNFSTNNVDIISNTEENKTTMTVDYNGGVTDNYIVVCAFGNDDMTSQDIVITSYGATEKIMDTDGSVKIDITNWKDDNGNLPDFNNLTFKVWMEDAETDRLKSATIPSTWEYNSNKVAFESKTLESQKYKNNRVFAMKSDLQCSWGKLNNEYELVGENCTNQKIYFGRDVNVDDYNPLQFWIAGREDENGNISDTGNIMYLYQAKASESVWFNERTSTYAGRYQTPTLNLARDKQSSYVSPNIPVQYNGEIAYKEKGGVAINKVPNLQFQYCLANNGKIIGQEWLPGMPRTLGTYYIRAIAPRNDVGEEERYEQVYSEPVQFKVIYSENESPRIVGSSFNLTEGKIILMLYIKNLSKENPAAYFEYNNKQYPLRSKKKDVDGLIPVRVLVDANKVSEEHTISLMNDKGEYIYYSQYTISVRDYFEKLIVGEKIIPKVTMLTPSERKILTAMLNYCTQIQLCLNEQYLNKLTYADLANNILPESERNISQLNLETYKFEKLEYNKLGDIKLNGVVIDASYDFRLKLLADTILPRGLSVTMKGINSEISYEVYGKFIEIKGISAKDLGTDLVISGANNECIAKFSYLDLIYSRLTGEKENKSYNYRNFIIAILAYYNAINNK